MHSFLSSFRFACVINLFLIASGGLHQLIGEAASKHFATLTRHFFKGDLCLLSVSMLWPLPISLTRSVSDAKPAMNWSLMSSSAKFSCSHCLCALVADSCFPQRNRLAFLLNEAEKFLSFTRNPDTSAIKFC